MPTVLFGKRREGERGGEGETVERSLLIRNSGMLVPSDGS